MPVRLTRGAATLADEVGEPTLREAPQDQEVVGVVARQEVEEEEQVGVTIEAEKQRRPRISIENSRSSCQRVRQTR